MRFSRCRMDSGQDAAGFCDLLSVRTRAEIDRRFTYLCCWFLRENMAEARLPALPTLLSAINIHIANRELIKGQRCFKRVRRGRGKIGRKFWIILRFQREIDHLRHDRPGQRRRVWIFRQSPAAFGSRSTVSIAAAELLRGNRSGRAVPFLSGRFCAPLMPLLVYCCLAVFWLQPSSFASVPV